MNVVNHMGGTPLTLTRAILIRESAPNYIGQREAVASIHDVHRDGKGRATIGAGTFLNDSGLRELVKALVPEQATRFIDERVLAAGAQGVMWWRPAQSTMMWFNTRNASDGIGETHGRVPLPALVFYAGTVGWYVFAVKGDRRPTPDTPLFQSGMYNVWLDGKICVGNADVPAKYGVDEIDGYERAFFNSRFTHPNVQRGREITKFRGGPGALWRSLLKGRRKTFPQDSLVPAKATVGQFVEWATAKATTGRYR